MRNEAVAKYNEAKQYLTDCGYTIGKTFMVWCQGEADADSNRGAAKWKSNTLKLFNDMKDTVGLTDMMIIRIGHCATSGAAAIDEVADAEDNSSAKLIHIKRTGGVLAAVKIYDLTQRLRRAYSLEAVNTPIRLSSETAMLKR